MLELLVNDLFRDTVQAVVVHVPQYGAHWGWWFSGNWVGVRLLI